MGKVQTETKAKVDEVLAANGRPVTVLRFTGDISSSSRDTVLGRTRAWSRAARY